MDTQIAATRRADALLRAAEILGVADPLPRARESERGRTRAVPRSVEIEALAEQSARVAPLLRQIEDLERRVDALEARSPKKRPRPPRRGPRRSSTLSQSRAGFSSCTRLAARSHVGPLVRQASSSLDRVEKLRHPSL